MKEKLNRRDFIELSGKGMLSVGAGCSGVDQFIEQFTPEQLPTSQEGSNNAKSARSAISLPKGGGAVNGIGEKFQVNAFTGTANFSVPIYTSSGRNEFGPELSLQYSSGNGNGPFGLGWGFSFPKVSRKTDKGIPSYQDDKDVFLLSGAEDLVPKLDENGQRFEDKTTWPGYVIYSYRPRVEGLFARIEFWRNTKINSAAKHSFWKITTKQNITSIYGYSPSSRLKHPKHDYQVFEWMLELTFDAKGNYIFYTCKPDHAEDVLTNNGRPPIFESHRSLGQQGFQLYLKKIEYGNLTSLPFLNFQQVLSRLEQRFSGSQHFFTTLLDYGEHGQLELENNETFDEDKIPVQIISADIFSEKNTWELREDRFSTYRAGFEIRTYRRCERVLMFHNIKGTQTLVRSTDFSYDQNDYNGSSMLRTITQRGYRMPDDGKKHYSEEYYVKKASGWVESDVYAIKSFPPLDLSYSSFEPEKQTFRSMQAEAGDMPGASLNDPNYSLVDLFGTGLPDVLYTSPAGFYYWKNMGEGTFSRRRQLKNMPAGIRLDMAGVGFGDMAGDGQADLLVHEGANWGFYETNGNAGWQNFRPYKNQPTFELNAPNVRLLDLSGDGKADILRTDINSMVWFPCEGEEGFGAPRHIRRKRDLEEFPDVDFSNPRVKLADMTGDGLNDIVLVHDGRIDYWANMGNGSFSSRITLKNAPRFGYNFDPQRLFLVDIDGSGTSDMVYAESGKVRFWFNQSGNQWSEGFEINGTPAVTDQDSVQFTDILGCGCTCMLWTSQYRGYGRSHYMYLDFTGGVKPNLLIEISNNMGSVTKAQYKPSTHFYIKDYKKNHKRAWVSSLPFPVQVLEKTEKIDQISRTKLVSCYNYHHGFYDGKEREFRGFAYVEQRDTEYFDEFENGGLYEGSDLRNIDKGFHVPPVLTKTWFHTGAYNNEEAFGKLMAASGSESLAFDIHDLFKPEYYNKDKRAFDLENTVFDFSQGRMDFSTIHEAYRALRGQVLRKEIYALDDSEKESHPYTVSESNFKVRLEQRKGDNEHAVYFVHPHESLSYHYERQPDDPRMVQNITLEVDEYGNIKKSIQIAYPRRGTGHATEQQQLHATFTHNKYINTIDESDHYFVGVPCEQQTFEIHHLKEKLNWQEEQKISRQALLTALSELTVSIPHHQNKPGNFAKRRLSWSRHYFKKDGMAGCTEIAPGSDGPVRTFNCRLPLEEIGKVGLPYESYQAAFHDDHIAALFLWNDADRTARLEKAGYIKMESHWWVPSGQKSFNAARFFVDEETIDAFGNSNEIAYDDLYLLAKKVTNAIDQEVEIRNDYVTMQPLLIKDPNDIGSKVTFDALGLVTASAIMGKLPEGAGDRLNAFAPLWDYDSVYHQHIDNPYFSDSRSRSYLSDATTVMLYDLWRNIRLGINEPSVVYSITREQHQQANTPIQRKLAYFDGMGREVQSKIEADTDEREVQRWIGSGWKTYNNKGKVVRKFEPFYTYTPDFEDLYEIAEGDNKKGVSPILFYDPLERVVATIHPNGTFEKVIFDAWSEENWDVNDTVNWNPDEEEVIESWRTMNPEWKTWKQRILGNRSVTSINIHNPGTDPQDAALVKTMQHANTSTKIHLDTLGRAFLTVAKNNDASADNDFSTHVELDIQGNDLVITDPGGVSCFEHQFDMLKRMLEIDSNDAGKKQTFLAVDEQPYWMQDAKGTIIENEYDELRRPTRNQVTPEGDAAKKFTAIQLTYGRNVVNAKDSFLLGQVASVKDQSGILTNERYDFKGNLESVKRAFWQVYKGDVDVSTYDQIDTLLGVFVSSSYFDALNRLTESTSPDGSIFYPIYNPSNQLKALQVKIQGATTPKTFVSKIDYNARGQREEIVFDEDKFFTKYTYEPNTFRLKKLLSVRLADREKLQDCRYTYDAVGNITHIEDQAYERVYNKGDIVDPANRYTYDALYRMTKATGRHHVNSILNRPQNCDSKYTQTFLSSLRHADRSTNGRDLGNYTETFHYDKRGNLIQIKLQSKNGQEYTRAQEFAPDSNRILRSFTRNMSSSEIKNIDHDKNGNILNLNYLTISRWDYANQLREVEIYDQCPACACYSYGHDGTRSRKVIEKLNQKSREQLYLGGYDIYIEYGNQGNETKRKTTLHILDDQQRIALVEREGNATLYRYQFNNHLESACLEVDQDGNRISYEEYYAFGGTAFLAALNQSEVDRKRYRYSGKERDDETGLYYYGARYYIPWMGRWMKADPIGKGDGLNLYRFVGNNPIKLIDKKGLEGENTEGTSQNLENYGQVPAEASKEQVLGMLNQHFNPQGIEVHNIERNEQGDWTFGGNDYSRIEPVDSDQAGASTPSAGGSDSELGIQNNVGSLLGGAAVGAGVGYAFGSGLTFLAAANPIGVTVLAIGAIGYGAYQLYDNWDKVTAWSGRVLGNKGTSEDYFTLGSVVGGFAGAGLGVQAARGSSYVLMANASRVANIGAPLSATTMPHGFASKAQFSQAMQELRVALRSSGIKFSQVGVRGSSVTDVSSKSNLGFRFGGRNPSDLDAFVILRGNIGLSPSRNIPGFIHPNKMMNNFQPLQEWSAKWTKMLGREITPGGFLPRTLTDKGVMVK